MNIIEAFNKMNQGEVVVDPEGGVWSTGRWTEGSTWYEQSIPARLIPGEWGVAEDLVTEKWNKGDSMNMSDEPITVEAPEPFVVEVNGAMISLSLMDCFAGMDRMDAESVDVVVTSPPYNLGVAYGVYNDQIDRESYLDWLEAWAERVERVLSPQGSLFLNIGGTPRDPWVPMEAAMRIRKILTLQNTLHWVKSIAIEPEENGGDHSVVRTSLNVGHIKPINSQRFISDAHEYIFHFTKTGDVPLDRLAIGVPYKDKSNVTRWKSAGKDLRCRGNVWFIPYKTIKSRKDQRPHPATFPPKLAEMCIRVHGVDQVKLVMDPFMGLGSAAVACGDLGVSCVGFEIDPEYYNYSCRRFIAEEPKTKKEKM